MEPRTARFHTNLAHLLAEHDRNAAAIERYRIALECDPNFAEAHHGLAAAFLILGRRAEARAALEQAIGLRPRMPAPRIAMARILAEDGDFERSNAYARELLADFPKFADAYSLLALNLRDSPPRCRPRGDDRASGPRLLRRRHPRGLAFGIATVLNGRGRYEEAAHFTRSPTRDRPQPWRTGGRPSTSTGSFRTSTRRSPPSPLSSFERSEDWAAPASVRSSSSACPAPAPR